MNAILLAAGTLSFLMAAGHTAIGTTWVLPRLAADSLPRSPFGGGAMTSTFITVTWHAVGITLVSFGVILVTLARGSLGADGAVAARAIGGGFAAISLMVGWLWITRLRSPRDLLRAPMWVLFIAMASLCLVGAAR